MADMDTKVLIGNTSVGSIAIDENSGWHFNYAPGWRKNGFSLAPCLPLHAPSESHAVRNFFANMLPENDQSLEHLAQALQISRTNTFGLLLAIRHDLSGALHLQTREESPAVTLFRPIEDEEIASKLDNPINNPIDIWDNRPRLSLAGVQEKINVLKLNGQWGLGEGRLCSTHILKFDRTDQTSSPRHLVLNEYFSMQLARHLGFTVAETELQQFGSHRALVVKRFDRQLKQQNNEPAVLRRHLIDTCQALGLPVAYKYERPFGDGRDVADFREGVSLKKLVSLTGHCQSPQDATRNILDWTLFNLLIGNTDSHGKNYSFFVSKQGLAPTPWYDLLNTMLYQGEINTNLAMSIGDVFNPEEVHAFQLLSCATDIGIPAKILVNRLKPLCADIINTIHTITSNIQMNRAEQAFAKRYTIDILSRCRYFSKESESILSLKRLL